jgi:hypothetical protein
MLCADDVNLLCKNINTTKKKVDSSAFKVVGLKVTTVYTSMYRH